MRKHNALDLATELLRSEDPRIRVNVATALAIIGTRESIQELVSMACSDQEEPVRKRATDELVLLAKSEAKRIDAAAAIEARMEDPDRRLEAYDLLASLRNRGVSIPLPQMTLRERLRLAEKIRVRSSERFAHLRPMFTGTLIASTGLVLLSVLAIPHLDVASLLLWVALGSCLFPQLILVIAGPSLCWRPVSVESDRLGAFLVDARLALAGGVVLGLLLLVLSGLATSFDSLTGFYAPMVAATIMIAVVRLGCAGACGTFRKRGWDTAFEVLAGTGTGIAALLLTYAALWGWNDAITATSVLVLLPIAAGVAMAVASVDQQQPMTHPLFGRGFSVLACLVITTIAACSIAVAFTSRVSVVSSGNGTTTWRVPADQLPFQFPVAKPSQLLVRVGGPPGIQFIARPASSFDDDFFPPQWLASSPSETTIRWAIGPWSIFGRQSRLKRIENILPSTGQALLDLVRGKTRSLDSWPGIEIAIMPIATSNMRTVCWEGTVNGFAGETEVKKACEAAVKADGDKSRDYRGINRLANRDYPGALEDLSPFVNDSAQTRPNTDARRLLIDSISRGQNPLRLPAQLSERLPGQLNALCWTATTLGFAALPEVRDACDQAVRRSGGYPEYRDSRGLNLVMNGDLKAAIDDFRVYVKWGFRNPSARAERQQWIDQITKGMNPITVDVLRRLNSPLQASSGGSF